MSERFDVVVVGSGAGGGVVAGELADKGRRVLLLELGPHLTAADFTRWEAKATNDLWWPIRFALIDGGAGGAMPLLGGRCVGGTTTVNTKVALRATDEDYAKWHEAAGIVGAGGAPFGASDLDPHYEASSGASACASAATGARAFARSSLHSTSSERRSSRSFPTPTRTA